MESNDSPEIPYRGETSDTPASLRGATGNRQIEENTQEVTAIHSHLLIG